ncbi:hypothetical protein [Roseibium aggregatum]|uniref:Uncharacterized protein n=1 Tax=Roseibium aggregatum TaxID=187304 RepID=A0A926S893_9HYPH|nr:hypothetical protein [Roseibium aggregatum]MBD1549606.1 hypothetical protein [Roseibium aggregatum]
MTNGNDTAAAQAVFDNLYAHYLQSIPVYRTDILWSGPVYIALYALVLIGGFWLLSFHLSRTGGANPKLYHLTSFEGHLTERVGKLALFSYFAWGTVIAWAAYFAIKQALYGLIY